MKRTGYYRIFIPDLRRGKQIIQRLILVSKNFKRGKYPQYIVTMRTGKRFPNEKRGLTNVLMIRLAHAKGVAACLTGGRCYIERWRALLVGAS